MKKILLVTAIIIALIITGISYVQAAGTTATISSSVSSVKPGDTFTVTLFVECDGGLALVSGNEEYDGFKFVYDTDKLELVSKEAKNSSDLNAEVNSDSICLIGNNTSFSSGNICELTFKVKANVSTGSTQISTTLLKIMNFDDVETEVNTTPVTIQITGNSPSGNTNTSVNTTTGGNTTTSGNTILSNSSTAGKSTDNTTAKSILPDTGSKVIVLISTVALIGLSVAIFKKLKNLDEIE